MSNGSTFGFLAVALAVAATGPSGCNCSDDAERAAAERAKIRSVVESSYALVPYRTLKVLVRAGGGEERPKELEKLIERVPGPEQLPEKIETPEEARRVAGLVIDLAVLLYDARAELARHDEDKYPLLWTAWLKEPPPASWYGNDAEHLAVATAWIAGELLDKSGRTPSLEYAFYELSRAEPQRDWPVPVKLWGRLARGLAFCGAGYHYAAEEELTSYLALADGLTPSQRAALRLEGLPPELDLAEVVRAAGRFARAWNRIGLRRDDAATDDLEQGLASLKKAGVDNELTMWGWAFVYYQRGKHAEAGKELERLAASPSLDEATRAELAAAAQDLKKTRPGIFCKAKAAAFLGGALLARAGGAEAVLATLLGPERARRAWAPMVWLARVRDGVGKHATPDTLAAAVREKAREQSARALELLKGPPALPANPLDKPVRKPR